MILYNIIMQRLLIRDVKKIQDIVISSLCLDSGFPSFGFTQKAGNNVYFDHIVISFYV